LLFALLVACAAAIPKGYIRVPGGKLAHRDCIHKAPNGARISRLESGAGYRIEPSNDSSDETAVMFEAYEITKCKHRLLRAGQGVAEPGQPEPQHGAAWIVDAMQDNSAGNGFTLFAANFTIPPPPSNVDVLLYYWPGTEDEVMGDVIQPVLQFGSNGEEGGPYWSYMAWYVSGDGDVITGPFITPISAGTSLGGWVQLSADGQSYIAYGNVPSGGTAGPTTSIQVATSESTQQTRAYLTIEIYEINGDCTKLPPNNQLVFTDLVMFDGSHKSVKPNMVKEVQPGQVCNHDVIPDGTTVTITWQST